VLCVSVNSESIAAELCVLPSDAKSWANESLDPLLPSSVDEPVKSESGSLVDKLSLFAERSCVTGLFDPVAELTAARTCCSTALVVWSVALVEPLLDVPVLLNVLGSIPLLFSTPTKAL